MDSKLTLKLDKNVIEKAKEYASLHKRSLSRMIEAYLKSLTDLDTRALNNDIEISPFVKSIATGVHLPLDIDSKKEYNNYLADKHK